MTIIQSLYRDIPVIIYNEQSESTFWGEDYESNNDELEKKLLYWKKLNKKDTLSKLKIIKNRLNINNQDVLKTIINDIHRLYYKN